MAPFDSAAAETDSDAGSVFTLASFELVTPLSVAPETFRLQLFHAADQEGGIPALDDAPRFSAVLAALRAQDVGADATLTLSSGDAYIPGVFASASESVFGARFRGDILIQNELGFEAIAFGNHEFDLGTSAILAAIGPNGAHPGAMFPYLSGNLDFSADANLSGLVVADGGAPQAGKITGSVVIERGGELIGVVSATTPTLPVISSPGAVGVAPTPFGGAPSAAELDALAALIQADVDALIAANPGLDKVILLAHMQQISIEQALAERLTGVDVIVAGGSNTRLLDDDDVLRAGDTIQGPYPIIKTAADGAPVAIVNTDGNYKYVGRLVIDFDADGEIIPESYDQAVSGAYRTDDAGVAALGAEGLVDPEIQAIVDSLETVIAAQDGAFFGVTEVFLEGRRGFVRTEETNFGNLTADANLAAAKAVDPSVVVSIKNGGGIRNAIGEIVTPPGATEPALLPPEGNALSGRPEGGISQIVIQNALSFNNGLSLVTLTRAELLAVLEHAVSAVAPGATPGSFPQVSGVSFSVDATRSAGDRILSAAIVDEDGVVLDVLARNGDLVGDAAQTVRIVTLNFLAGGGDGYPFPTGSEANRLDLYDLDGDTKLDGARNGVATFANDGTEQDALAEHLAATYGATNPFDAADTPESEDTRIQNLAERDDTVLPGVINEFVFNHVGTDTNEYVEIFGAAGADLSGYTLLQIEGDGNAAGVIDSVIALGTTDADGFWTTGFLSDEFENGTVSLLLVSNFTGTDGDDLDTNDDGVLDATPWSAVIDGVAVTDGGADDRTYAAPVLIPGFDGVRFAPGGASRIPNGTDTDTAADWTRNDFDLAGLPGFAGSLSPGEAVNTPAAANTTELPPPPPPPPTRISAVQGAGAASQRVGETVTVEAIVVGDFQNGDADPTRDIGGFFLQEEDADADGDAATSEGLFIRDGATFADVEVGQVVRVTGVVAESNGRTQLSNVSAVTVVGTAAAQPTAAELDLPADDAAREAFENMLVSIPETLTVSEMFNLDRFGEIRLVEGEREQSFTQDNAPSVAGFAAHVAELARRSLVLDDGRDAQNQPIEDIDGFAGFDTASAPRMGDTVAGLTGVLDYGFGAFRVRSVAEGSVVFEDGANARTDAPEDVGGRLKVASFNVLNYFSTIDLPGVLTAVGADPRGADSVAEFARQTEKLVTAILGTGAQVLGLVELENDFEPGADGNAVETLVEAINAVLGGDYFDSVNPGDKFVGEDAISTGFIYDTRAVGLVGDAAVLDNPSFTDPLGYGDQQSRPAVAQSFVELASGAKFTAVANHFKSKGASSPIGDDVDQLDGQGAHNATRTEGAKALAAWLDTDPTGVGDADVLLMGDLNAYAEEDPIRALEAAGYVDLGDAFEGDAPNYSYVFDGQTGTLDYAMANGALLGQVTGATEWRINSDEADALDYNLDFGRDAGYFDGSVPFRSSDHDPIVVGLDLSVAREGTARNDRIAGGDYADVIATLAGRNDVATGGRGADTFVFGAETLNGKRETDQIRDYDAHERDVIDLGGAMIASVRETRSAVRITLEGDGDVIIVRGVSDFDDIAFADQLVA